MFGRCLRGWSNAKIRQRDSRDECRIAHLGKQQSLRFQLQRHPMAVVIDELFQSEKFDCTQRAPVSPEYADFQFA